MNEQEQIEAIEKWKAKSLDEIKTVTGLDTAGLDEYFGSMFDMAFTLGKGVGMDSAFDRIKEKLDGINKN